MGAIFDSTCEVWQENCNGTGSCWIYDNFLLSIRLVILGIVVKSVSTFFFVLALILYKAPPSSEKQSIQMSDNTGKADTTPVNGTSNNQKDGFINYGADTSNENIEGGDLIAEETTDL